jgi:hypothetical protein
LEFPGDGMNKILQSTVYASLKLNVVKDLDFQKGIADTIVMESNVCYSTDAFLLHDAREKLVKKAKE